MAEVTLRKVVKTYGSNEVIHGIDLKINSGEFVVFVGPSGCGKSTLLRMVAGLEDITAGEIVIGGTVVNDLPPRARDIAMVFQDYALYPHKSGDADARSANWYMVFFSPATKQRIAITIANGVMTCYQDTDSPGRIPILKSGVYLDVKQVLATASEKGGAALVQKGALPSVEMSAGSEDQRLQGTLVRQLPREGRSVAAGDVRRQHWKIREGDS